MQPSGSSYVIEFELAAARALRRLAGRDRAAAKRIGDAIDQLATAPRPPGAKALQGTRGALRLRVGDYRVLYEVHDSRLVVLVVGLGHRRDVYKH